jgi:hypothetical protein
MKKSAIFLKAVSKTTGLLAVLLTLGLVLAGCDNDSGGGGGGGDIDSALVAKWYRTQSDADAGGMPIYELRSDGKILVAGQDQGNTFSTSGGKITIYDNGQTTGTADYTIEGTKLTLSNPSDSSKVPSGTFYKSGGSSGSPDPALVAKWYFNQDAANQQKEDALILEFKSDGKLLIQRKDDGNTFSTSGGKIMVYDNKGQIAETLNYTIEGTKLTISGAKTQTWANSSFFKKQ